MPLLAAHALPLETDLADGDDADYRVSLADAAVADWDRAFVVVLLDYRPNSARAADRTRTDGHGPDSLAALDAARVGLPPVPSARCPANHSGRAVPTRGCFGSAHPSVARISCCPM